MTEFRSKNVSAQLDTWTIRLIKIVVLILIMILLVYVIGAQWDVTCKFCLYLILISTISQNKKR